MAQDDDQDKALDMEELAEAQKQENAKFMWHVVRNAKGFLKLRWQNVRRRYIGQLSVKVRDDASLGGRMDALNNLSQQVYPGGTFIKFPFAASAAEGAEQSGVHHYGQWSRDCFDSVEVVRALCVAMALDPMLEVREAAAIYLGELKCTSETTKHALCAAVASGPPSLASEAAAALERLFPPGGWSDGVESLDAELIGTLSLLW